MAEYRQSPKRREDGEEIFYSSMKKPKGIRTVIVDLNGLEKEYLLVLARLKLVQYGKNENVAIGRYNNRPVRTSLRHLNLFDVLTSAFRGGAYSRHYGISFAHDMF